MNADGGYLGEVCVTNQLKCVRGGSRKVDWRFCSWNELDMISLQIDQIDAFSFCFPESVYLEAHDE